MDSGLETEYVVKEGSTVRLLCEATGVPSPTIHWHRPAAAAAAAAGTQYNHTVQPLLVRFTTTFSRFMHGQLVDETAHTSPRLYRLDLSFLTAYMLCYCEQGGVDLMGLKPDP